MAANRSYRLLLVVLAIAIAAYAQYIIAQPNHCADGLPGLASFDDKLTEIYGVGQSVAMAIPLFAVAMALFAWALRGISLGEPAGIGVREHENEVVQRSPREPRIIVAGSGVALVGWTYLTVRLAIGAYEGWYVALFFGLLVLSTAIVWLASSSTGQARWPAFHAWELVFVACASGLFLGLVFADLTNWRYASLGDDGTFFVYARDILHGQGHLNLFSQDGPAGNHPLLSSAYQAAVMRVAGEDILGWKLATLIVVVAALPVYYLLMRAVTTVRVAVLATCVLASSHYLLGYAHTGYDSVFPLLPTAVALLCYTVGTRRSTPALLFAAGVAAGLGFYTFYSSRATIVILAVLLLLGGRQQWRAGAILPLFGGFVLAVAPLFAVEGWEVVSEMQAESGASGSSFGETLGRLAANTPRSLLAFSFNPYPKHYVSGSLLDDVSAPFALLGLGYAMTRFRESGSRLLLVWFGVAIVATGLFHPHPAELTSRLHYVLPPMAAFVALAVDGCITALCSLISRERARSVASIALSAAFLFVVLGLNLYRHYVVSPRATGVSEGALVLREAQRSACETGDGKVVVFAEAPFPVMPLVFDYYGWEERLPFFFRFDDPGQAYREVMQDRDVSCVLVVGPDGAVARAVVDYVTAFAEQRGAGLSIVRDASGHTAVLVLHLVPE